MIYDLCNLNYFDSSTTPHAIFDLSWKDLMCIGTIDENKSGLT